jgi:hypothetical protein
VVPGKAQALPLFGRQLVAQITPAHRRVKHPVVTGMGQFPAPSQLAAAVLTLPFIVPSVQKGARHCVKAE